jgi:hypothetical protein
MRALYIKPGHEAFCLKKTVGMFKLKTQFVFEMLHYKKRIMWTKAAKKESKKINPPPLPWVAIYNALTKMDICFLDHIVSCR